MVRHSVELSGKPSHKKTFKTRKLHENEKNRKEYQSSSSLLDRPGVGAEFIIPEVNGLTLWKSMKVKFNLNFVLKYHKFQDMTLLLS